MVSDKKQIDVAKLDNFILELEEIVGADDRVSMDEERILSSIINDLDGYRKLLQEVLEDGIIDDSEKQKMSDYKESILRNASSRAFADGKLTSDERILLNAVVTFVDNHFI